MQRELAFEAPALAGTRWPVIDVVGTNPGPMIAVMAGVHPNEVAAIEAVIRLAGSLDPTNLRGRVSLLPVANRPGYSVRAEAVVPIDGRNLNFAFPGRRDGSFTEALGAALLDEWAQDAICLVDLHGGDLREEMARFVVAQTTGDPGFDARQLELARSYGARFLVRLGPENLDEPGRSITGRARRRQHGVFAEGGSHGMLDQAEIRYHYEGVLGVLSQHGMYPGPVRSTIPIELTEYRFLTAPVNGWARSLVAAGDQVDAAQRLVEFVDWSGRVFETLTAPAAGYILWRVTHPIVSRGDAIVGLGRP